MSYLVANPEDRFSRDEAQMPTVTVQLTKGQHKGLLIRTFLLQTAESRVEFLLSKRERYFLPVSQLRQVETSLDKYKTITVSSFVIISEVNKGPVSNNHLFSGG